MQISVSCIQKVATGMSIFDLTIDVMRFQREQTLRTLDEIASLPDSTAVLGFRPGPGRAHIAWQLMHIAATEELMATDRLLGTTPRFPELMARFQHGSTPDDDIPTVAEILELLAESREDLICTLSSFTEDDLGMVPKAFAERGWSLGTVLKVLCWHEPHHQGQAHITFNLWKNREA